MLSLNLKKLNCGVPQESVLGPFEFCNYLIPLGNILKYHNVQYLKYADDTQVYISFKLKTPHEAVDTINECFCDLRTWMIIGYEPAGLTMHPPPKRSRVGSFFSHRCLVLPKFFPQRKSGFCRRY